jgi:hypothetical protein
MSVTGTTLLAAGVVLIVLGLGAGQVEGRVFSLRLRNWTLDYAGLRYLRAVPIALGVMLILAVAVPPAYEAVAGSSSDDPRLVEITAPDGESGVAVYGGPSTQTSYQRRGNVASGTQVRLVCTVYGEPIGRDGSSRALWDYTDKGWINDHFVATNVSGPAANACTGSVTQPVEGSTVPSQTVGPFAIVADEGAPVPLRREASLSAATLTSLPGGTFVVLRCSVRPGPVVAAPRGYATSNNDWDQLVNQSDWDQASTYWVPDSFVASYSPHSTAPACS